MAEYPRKRTPDVLVTPDETEIMNPCVARKEACRLPEKLPRGE